MYESKDNLWEEKCIGQTISKQFEQTIIFQKWRKWANDIFKKTIQYFSLFPKLIKKMFIF